MPTQLAPLVMQAAFREGSVPLDLVSDTELAGLGLYTRDATQRWVYGQRHLTVDGRVFKYSQAGGTLNTDLLAQSVVAQHVAQVNVAASTIIGAREITIDVGGTDGAAAGGIIAENELAGGYIIIFPGSENSMNRMIVGNTAVAAGGGEMTLTLDFALNIATTLDDTVAECMASPYSSIKASTVGDTARGFVGLPVVPAASGEKCWIQTWGPCWVAPQTNVGAAAEEIQVVARYDGTIQTHETYTAADAPTDTERHAGVEQQHVGFVLTHATAGTQGAPFIMLQISR